MGSSRQQSSQELDAKVPSDQMLAEDGLADVPVNGIRLFDAEPIEGAKMIQESRVKQATSENREMASSDGSVVMAQMDLGPRSHRTESRSTEGEGTKTEAI